MVDGPVGDFFPHVLEVDLPLIVLKLSAHFLDLLINQLSIKVDGLPAQLSIELVIELLLQLILKHIKQVTDLPFVLDHNLIDPFGELPHQRQGFLVPGDDFLVNVRGLLTFADGDLFELAAGFVLSERSLELEEEFVLFDREDDGGELFGDGVLEDVLDLGQVLAQFLLLDVRRFLLVEPPLRLLPHKLRKPLITLVPIKTPHLPNDLEAPLNGLILDPLQCEIPQGVLNRLQIDLVLGRVDLLPQVLDINDPVLWGVV